jgi:adenylate kinase
MNLIILGAPGSGKGTQAKLIAEHYGLKHISSGQLLRSFAAENTKKSIALRTVMEQGLLVPFDTVMDIVGDAILASPSGFVLDGSPRNLAQAEHLDWYLEQNNIKINYVIRLDVPDEDVIQRIVKRAVTEGRSDDNPKTVKERLKIYHGETEPVIKHYRSQNKLIDIDGRPSVEAIIANIVKEIDNKLQNDRK